LNNQKQGWTVVYAAVEIL